MVSLNTRIPSSRSLCLLGLLAGRSIARVDHIEYSVVTGYFLQDNNSTNATTFDYTAVNFGLINQTYDSSDPSCNTTQWQRFTREVSHLNAIAPSNTDYKVLFMGRHGEGYHNTAESYYGTPAWNCFWSLQDGNATTTWIDAHLTPDGIEQALIANALWRHELAVEKIPAPQSYYVSPLYRCLSTANYTFSGLDLPPEHPFIPTVKEKFREGISEHTCDHRSNKTLIQSSFPSYIIEDGFTEYDELWSKDLSETQAGQDARSKSVLDDVFENDKNTWISITSHSGEIASLLRVLGHRPFSLNTGAVIPVLVKALRVSEPEPTVTAPARTHSAYCTDGPPVTSISGASCVCQMTSTSLWPLPSANVVAELL